MAVDLNQTISAPEEGNPSQQDELSMLDAMGQSLAKGRSKAIQHRESSGIEWIWKEDTEFYEGIDDANRHEHHPGAQNWTTKIPGKSSTRAKTTTRSRVFPNLTGPFTDAAVARISDMLLPTDDRPWAFNARQDPKLIKIIEEGKAMAKKQREEAAREQRQGRRRLPLSSSPGSGPTLLPPMPTKTTRRKA